VKFSKDLDDALTQSEAPWKIVVSHHPISNAMQARGADMYVNGHDHCLQHISSRDR